MKTIPTAEILKEAKIYIGRGWIQFAYAKNEVGPCSILEPSVTCLCPIGALRRACHNLGGGYYEEHESTVKAIAAIAGELGLSTSSAISCVINWNDEKGRTQAEVLDVFQKAIDSLPA